MNAKFPVLGRIPKPLLAALVIVVVLSSVFIAYGPRISIPFSTLWEGWHGSASGGFPYLTSGQLVINDNKTFSEMWTQRFCYYPGRCSAYPPQVNFTSKTVLVEFYNGHRAVEIFRVGQVDMIDPHILVDMKLVNPTGCLYPTISYYWSHIVVIDKTMLPVRFAITETVSEVCPSFG